MWGVQCWNSSKLLSILNLAGMPACGHAHSLFRDSQTKEHRHMLSIYMPAGASSLMLLGILSIGATYSNIVWQTSEYVPGIGVEAEGRTWMRGGYNRSMSFLCDCFLSFASIYFYRRKREACMEEHVPVWWLTEREGKGIVRRPIATKSLPNWKYKNRKMKTNLIKNKG